MAQTNKYLKPMTKRMLSSIIIVDGKAVSGTFDFYDVANSFDMVNEQVKHATKKCLQSGGRLGGKSQKQDLEEALWSLSEGIKELD